MSKTGNNLKTRIVALIMTAVMTLSLLPISAVIAFAETVGHEDTVTISVSDGTNYISGATVDITVNSVINGQEYITKSLTTDANGCVEVMASGDFVADDFTLYATVEKDGYFEEKISGEITSGTQDFKVVMHGITVSAKEGLVYNKGEQELVTLTGDMPGDTVSYKVNGAASDDGKATAAGTYEVEVTVERAGKTSTVVKTVEATIGLADINLGNLSIEANKISYDGEYHKAITVKNAGDYTLKYSFEENGTYSDVTTEEPKVKDFKEGGYDIYIKAVKDENYNEAKTEAFPVNVFVSKGAQELVFKNYTGEELLEVELNADSQKNVYDFTAEGENLSEKDIVYSSSDEDVATIDENGTVTVLKAGETEIKATRAGSDNYEEAKAEILLLVKASGNGLVAFGKSEVNYTLKDEETVSELSAEKTKADDNGKLTYKLDKTNIGLAIDANGKVSVSDIEKLTDAIEKAQDEKLNVVVTAEKGEDKITVSYRMGKTHEYTKYSAASASYVLHISREAALGFDDAFTISAPDETTGWYNIAKPAKVSLKDTEKYAFALGKPTGFTSEEKTIEENGEKEHKLYIKDKETGNILAPTKKAIKVDTTAPDADALKITYETNIAEKILEAITFGFYKPSVSITFTGDDGISGIAYFVWKYDRSGDASTINHEATTDPAEVQAVKVAGEETKYTITPFSITADEYHQYRGYLTVYAVDKAGNKSGEKSDSGKVFIVDTVSPEMSIKYSGSEPYEGQQNAKGENHYFNGDVAVELTVKEANFYSELFTVKVAKDGGNANSVSVNWGTKDENDNTVGTFTLSADGDYVVSVEGADKTENPMAPYTSEHIIVDKTVPIVEATTSESEQSLTVSVKEHNFDPAGFDLALVKIVDINGNDISNASTQSDNLLAALRTGEWKQDEADKDKYTFTTDDFADGNYSFVLVYKDLATNVNVQDVQEAQPVVYSVDHTVPDDIQISYSQAVKDIILEALTLGFYKADVTVTFKATDNTVGVDRFVWSYKRADDASKTNLEKTDEKTIENTEQDAERIIRNGNEFSAEVVLTFEEYQHLRGNITVTVFDRYNNSASKTDDPNEIVLDNKKPERTVSYSEANRVVDSETLVEKENYDYSGEAQNAILYYNDKATVYLTITEVNFNADGVVVKDNDNDVSLGDWKQSSEDEDVYTNSFEITDEGSHVITMTYTDRSGNEMDSYVSEKIIVDKTLPVIETEYGNKNVINAIDDIKYYDEGTTLTITIKDDNFRADDVKATVVAKDITGADIEVSDYSEILSTRNSWTKVDGENSYKATVNFDKNANYIFDISYTDLAMNESEDYKADMFAVDTEPPVVVSVEYSESILDTVLETISFGFYNAEMTVTITAEDVVASVYRFDYSYINAPDVSEVNAQLLDQAIREADIKYSLDGKTATMSFKIPKEVLEKDNQFNGNIKFNVFDRSENKDVDGEDVKNKAESQRIVVDNIAPTATVEYNVPVNEMDGVSYYDGNINGTITINEANFYSEDVVVKVSKDGAESKTLETVWTDVNVDVHVGTFVLTEDGDYIVSVSYSDKSGNKMTDYKSNQRTIDTKIEEPVYTINGKSQGGENGGAYNDDAKVSYSFEDQNYNTHEIKLTRTRFDKVENVTSKFISPSLNTKGGSGTFSIPKEVGNDGIYTLTVSMTDRANHSTESHVKFTVNRFGSVYEYGEYLCGLIKDGGQYIKLGKGQKAAITEDLVITEYNADKLLADSLKILITRDGEAVDAKYTSNPEKINGEVKLGNGNWYKYIYTINKDNFKEDGLYKITISSKDATGNESTSIPDNSLDAAGQKILGTMNFTVDTTAPEIRNIINLEKAIASRKSIVDGKLNVKYNIVDVGGLAKVEVYLNDVVIDTISKFGNNNNYTGSFDIGESNDIQTVRLSVTDLAGNVIDTGSEEFNPGELYVFNSTVTVSTNFFVRWYRNTPLFFGSIGGIVAIGVALLVILKKKRKA